jgi:ABC-type sugar transport system ATPase subunit
MSIRVENLHKSFETDRVLDGITLEVPDRSFFSVVAPTGAGKTTLLRILAGIEPLDEGRVYYDGEDVTDRRVQDRSVGMVYQAFINYPSLTVWENLASPLRASKEGYSEEEIERRVQETAEMLKIDHILDSLPEQCSGGEAQRTAISRALIREPDYLFMDEPLANLDYKLREELRSDFERLFSEQETTVVYATPKAGDALSMSTRIGFLHEGTLIQEAPTDEIYYRPRYAPVAEYLGEPPMNTLPVTLTKDAGGARVFEMSDGVQIPAASFPDLATGQPYLLGIRPQDMMLLQDGRKAEATQPTIAPRLSFVETVGSTSTLHMEFQGQEIYALNAQPVHRAGRHGDRHGSQPEISFALDPEKFYVYDPDSSELVATGGKIPTF